MTKKEFSQESCMQIFGWMYAEACTMLERGEDPRDALVPDLLKRARKDLIGAVLIPEDMQRGVNRE